MREKAEFLLDLSIENTKVKKKDLKMDWSNERLLRAMKMLIYFSEVLPLQFINHYKDSNVIYEMLLGKE